MSRSLRATAFAFALGVCTVAVASADPAPAGRAVTPQALDSPDGGVRVRAALISAPTNDQLARYYPKALLRSHQGGRAVIRCKVTLEGALDACGVVSAAPVEFGVATVKAAHLFRARPAMQDGTPVEGVITIPVVWTVAY
jgi:TonB family protein